MEFIKINATIRNSKGKGAARRLRAAGLTPAVIYGKETETLAVSVDPKVLVKALSGALRINTPLDVTINDPATGKTIDVLAIVKDHQYDPISRELLHVDFVSIKPGQEIEVTVPIIRKGRSVGEQLGGILRMVRRNAPVVCMPRHIPANITIDVSKLTNGVTMHAADVPMPEGVRFNLADNAAILTVSAIQEDENEAETAAGENT